MDKPLSLARPPISSFRLFVVVDGCCTLRQATVVLVSSGDGIEGGLLSATTALRGAVQG